MSNTDSGQLILDCPDCGKETVILIDTFYEEPGTSRNNGDCEHCGCAFAFDLIASILNKEILCAGGEV